MCGIAGFIDISRQTAPDALSARAKAMSDALIHRGPDDSGVHAEAESGLAMAFRRLAIIDLTETGHQPMTSADGRWTVTYNGEIYNYRDLRSELEAAGVAFRGQSDTEVMLEHVARHGPAETAKRLVGMFAIALWDRKERQLWLIRDRLGIKPLYWGRQGDLFLWGSELKALRANAGFETEVDRTAVARFLRFNYVPAPRTIYRGVEKLVPGGWLRLDISSGDVEQGRYWSMADVVSDSDPIESPEKAVEQLETLLRDAVESRMVADVPLGALLSGGVDSSTVVALMQQVSGRPVKTFTIGLDNQGYDEAAHAKQVAAHLKTDHTELYLDPRAARDLIPQLPDWYDEPFADSSALPTYLVSRLARGHVTVALSGDGGDELFFGYNRHAALARLGALDKMPNAVSRLSARGIDAVGPEAMDRLAALIPEKKRPRQAGDKAAKLARALRAGGPDRRYLDVVSHWFPEEGLVDDPDDDPLLPDGGPDRSDPAARAAWFDTLTYLPDDILTKVDRASMAVSLEARVPLLDHRVVELAWRMPTSVKLRKGTGKWPLREVLYKHVPRHLVERPKAGFAIPLGDWLRGPLQEWAEGLLSEDALKKHGFVEAEPVRAAWKAHLDGHGAGRSEALWGVLMLHSWADRWLEG